MSDSIRDIQVPSAGDFLAALDVEAGWPPRFRAGPATALRTESSENNRLKLSREGPIGDTDRRALIQTAIGLSNVQPLLAGRWAVLGVHRLRGSSNGLFREDRIRICIFNYTSNTLVDVFLTNGILDRVVNGLSHQHPETAMEVAQAVAMVRADPILGLKVKGLVGQGILRVPPNRDSPSYRHRCIHVIFTKGDDRYREQGVEFSAFVDLTLQQVTSLGSCGCEIGEGESK